MRPQLRTKMLSILEDSSKGELKGVILRYGDDPLKIEAVYLLLGHGALEAKESRGSYKITISGYGYYQEFEIAKGLLDQEKLVPCSRPCCDQYDNRGRQRYGCTARLSCRPCGLSYDRHPRCLHRPHGLRPHPHGLLVFWNLHRQQRDQMQPKLEPPIPSRP